MAIGPAGCWRCPKIERYMALELHDGHVRSTDPLSTLSTTPLQCSRRPHPQIVALATPHSGRIGHKMRNPCPSITDVVSLALCSRNHTPSPPTNRFVGARPERLCVRRAGVKTHEPQIEDAPQWLKVSPTDRHPHAPMGKGHEVPLSAPSTPAQPNARPPAPLTGQLAPTGVELWRVRTPKYRYAVGSPAGRNLLSALHVSRRLHAMPFILSPSPGCINDEGLTVISAALRRNLNGT
jgi:hypothetical protein